MDILVYVLWPYFIPIIKVCTIVFYLCYIIIILMKSKIIRDRKNRVKVSLLSVFIIPFIIQIVLYTTVISYFSYQNGKQAVYKLYQSLVYEISRNVENQIVSIFDEPNYINQLNALSISNGYHSANNQDALESHFINQIETFQSVSSIYFGNIEGGLVDAGRDLVDDSLYVINTENFKAGTFNKHSINKDRTYNELLLSIVDFDSRTRSWYQNAVNKQSSVWSDIYILFTGHDMAISTSKPVYNQSGELLGVVSNDISLSKLNNILSGFESIIPGTYFLVDSENLLIASSTAESTIIKDQTQLRRKHIRDATDPVMKKIGELLLIENSGTENNNNNFFNFSDFEFNGDKYLYHINPLSDDIGQKWFFCTIFLESEVTKNLHDIKTNSYFMIIAALMLSIVTSILLYQLIVKPIRRLNSAVKSFAVDRRVFNLNPECITEIDDVSGAFNEMSIRLNNTMELLSTKIFEQKQSEKEKLELERQYYHSQKIESIGMLTGGIAHDLNNLLTPIIGYCEFLAEEFIDNHHANEMMSTVLTASFKARDLIKQLLAYSRKQTLEYRVISLNEVIKDIELIFKRTLRENIYLRIDTEPNLPYMHADTGQIEQVLTNLLVNSQDAMPEGGTISIETQYTDFAENFMIDGDSVIPGKYCILRFTDTGIGIDDSIITDIFNPFFTTKGDLGTGLGLSTSYGIIKQHKGYMFVESKLDSGTTFIIYLPAMDSVYSDDTDNFPQPRELKGTETILLCEDNSMVLDFIESILSNNGYKVHSASDPLKALELAEKHKGEIDLLLSDIILPEINGKELYHKVSEIIADVKILYISGYTDNLIDQQGIAETNYAFLMKPFSISSLLNKIREVIEQPEGRAYHDEIP